MMPKLGFGLSLSKDRNIMKDSDDVTLYGAMLYYVIRPIITTQKDYEESLTATADLTYTVSVT